MRIYLGNFWRVFFLLVHSLIWIRDSARVPSRAAVKIQTRDKLGNLVREMTEMSFAVNLIN